jgi:acid phosphatase family membrane protein YuiD
MGRLPDNRGGSARIKRDREGEEGDIQFDSPEEAARLASIIRAIKRNEKKSLADKVKETLVTEPIKAVFAVIVGIIVAFLIWYFELRP